MIKIDDFQLRRLVVYTCNSELTVPEVFTFYEVRMPLVGFQNAHTVALGALCFLLLAGCGASGDQISNCISFSEHVRSPIRRVDTWNSDCVLENGAKINLGSFRHSNGVAPGDGGSR